MAQPPRFRERTPIGERISVSFRSGNPKPIPQTARNLVFFGLSTTAEKVWKDGDWSRKSNWVKKFSGGRRFRQPPMAQPKANGRPWPEANDGMSPLEGRGRSRTSSAA